MKPSAIVVALDCATDATSVALLVPSEEGWFRAVASQRDSSGARHGGGVLLPLMARLLQEVGASQEDIAALVVGTGPGTFTGVRIAVATARGLALALQKPVFGVTTLQAVAAQALSTENSGLESAVSGASEIDLLIPVVDARRGQVFACSYLPVVGPDHESEDGRRLVWSGDAPVAVAPDDVLECLLARRKGRGSSRSVVLVAGPGSLVHRCVPPGQEGRVQILCSELMLDAAWLVCGQEAFEGGAGFISRLRYACEAHTHGEKALLASSSVGDIGSPESVVPVYVRPPDADIHIKKMRDPWA